MEKRRNVPDPEMTRLHRFTCYRAFGDKITGLGGIWIRTTGLILDEFVIADTHEGLHMGSTGGHVNGFMLNKLVNSVVVGRTSNRGFDMGGESLVQKWNPGDADTGGGWTLPTMVDNMGVTGVRIYDGPTYIGNTSFVNFDFELMETGIPTSPIAGRMSNMFQLSTSSALEAVSFTACIRRITVIDRKGDGGLTFNMRDVDGSVTGAVDSTIVPDLEFYKTAACLTSPLYMQVCPHKYSNVEFTARGGFHDADADGDVGVDDRIEVGPFNFWLNDRRHFRHRDAMLSFRSFSSQAMPIMSAGGSYGISMSGGTPNRLTVQINNADPGDTFKFFLCLPAAVRVWRARMVGGSYKLNAAHLTHRWRLKGASFQPLTLLNPKP